MSKRLQATFQTRLLSSSAPLLRLIVLTTIALGVAALCAASGPAAGQRDARVGLISQAGDPPADPVCKGPEPWKRDGVKGSDAIPDPLCGSRGNDRITAGGYDYVDGYGGNDTIRARNDLPDEIDGGLGRDRAFVDRCDVDNLRRVEHVEIKGKPCPGLMMQGRRALQVAAELPYHQPVVECWIDDDGTRLMTFLREPQMRALDVTNKVDFQTVAWQPVVLQKVGEEWDVIPDDDPVWFWDRVYDEQVKAFAGNFWRSFETGRRTFVSYEVYEPGIYALAAKLHWYKTRRSGVHATADVARAHYGEYGAEDHSACEFPA